MQVILVILLCCIVAFAAAFRQGDYVTLGSGIHIKTDPCSWDSESVSTGKEAGRIIQIELVHCKPFEGKWARFGNSMWFPLFAVKPIYPLESPKLTAAQLRCLMPKLSISKSFDYEAPLNKALMEAGGTSRACIRAFLAQIAYESNELQLWEESGGVAACTAYNNRRDLCNGPSDGCKFRGRGPLRIRGRCEYAAASMALGLDLVNDNGHLSVFNKDVGFRTSFWLWKRHIGNCLDFKEITGRLTGNNYNDYDKRVAYFNLAKRCIP